MVAGGTVEAQTLVDESARGLSPAELRRTMSAVADNFADPLATQFRKLSRAHKNESVICGEVNAKNAFGAYVGFDPFTFSFKNEKAVIFERRLQSGSLDRETDMGLMILIGCGDLVGVTDPAEIERLKEVARWAVRQDKP